MITHPEWFKDALCAYGIDPEIFYSTKAKTIDEAKQICSRCPILEPCRQYALDEEEKYGTWGGTSEADRREIRARRAGK